MKAQTSRTELTDAAKWVSRAIGKNPQAPIMHGMIIESDGKTLSLSASDYDNTLRATIPAAVGEPGRVLIGGLAFAALVGNLPGSEVTLSATGDGVDVTAGRSRSTFQQMPMDDYPKLATVPESGSVGEMDAETLAALAGVVGALSFRDADAAGIAWQSGILIDSTDGVLTFTAGSRYALARIRCKSPLNDGRLLVPTKTFTDAVRGMRGPVTLHNDGGNLGLLTETRAVVMRLYVDQGVPNFDGLIDQKKTDRLDVNLTDLRGSVKLAGTASNRVKFDVSAAEIEVSAHTPEKGELRNTVSDVIGCEATAPTEFALSGEWLNGTLAGLTGEIVRIEYTPGKNAVAFTDAVSRFVIQGLKLAS